MEREADFLNRISEGTLGKMRAVTKLGESVWLQYDELRYAAAVIGTVLCVSVRPRYWGRPMRELFARQVLAVGVEPLAFVSGVAVLVGISLVVLPPVASAAWG